MKTKVPLSNLRAPDKMEKRKPAEPHLSTRVQLDKSRKASMEINLLGYTLDEARNEVDKFLDSGMPVSYTHLAAAGSPRGGYPPPRGAPASS